jgi:hypothetical protein
VKNEHYERGRLLKIKICILFCGDNSRVDQKIRRDKVHNQVIRMALNMKPLQSQIQQMQLRRFGHVARMTESGYPRMAWEAGYEGRRTRDRPRTKWQDNIQNALLEK